MEFVIKKCIMLKMKSGKIIEGMELPNQETIRTLDKKKITRTGEYWKSQHHQTEWDEQKKKGKST